MTPSRFDIYTRDAGRWSRKQSFPGEAEAAAMAHAVELDRAGGSDGVRVMAVVEYTNGRSPLETLSWISPHLSKIASVQRQLRTQAKSATEAAPQSYTVSVEREAPANPVHEKSAPQREDAPTARTVRVRQQAAAKNTGALRVTGVISANLLLAATIAIISFVPLSAMIKSFGPGLGLSAAVQGRTAFIMAMSVFFCAAAVLMRRVYRTYLIDAEAAPVAPPVRRETMPTPVPRGRQYSIRSETSADPVERETVETGEGTDDEDADPAAPTPAQPGMNEQSRRAVLEFLATALAAIKTEVPRMNQHVAFGLNLFAAGAAQRYAEHAGLNRMQSFVLIREMVEALGNTADRVDAFCRNLTEYAAEERYRMMFNAGRKVMGQWIAGAAEPFLAVGEVLQMWTSDAAARAKSQGIVCIMFTDIVGSTQMTHEHGDYAAQEVVRVHNAIVRQALAAFHGKEVKHTGDGIMASFSLAHNAARATVDIRDTLARHNAANSGVPVNVRIGLNAGDAVQEADDFFGTTVQLAARVCDKAGAGEIFVTDNIRELSKDYGITFEAAGAFEMKGVPEPMTLYRIATASEAANSE